MDIDYVKKEIAQKTKMGLPFILSASVLWFIIFIIFLSNANIKIKNIFTFYSTGLLFPLSILLAKILKCQWKVKNNDLNKLALYLNLAQLLYYPILFISFMTSPYKMIIFFAIIIGAHLFPYAWLYNTKTYKIIPIIIVITILIASLIVKKLFFIPLIMFILLTITGLRLYYETRNQI